VTTPNAVIGVIGTDFYVGFEKSKTTVICYEGKVMVTPRANAQAQNNSGQASGNSITVAAGQMVEIISHVPPGGFQTVSTPPAVQQGSQLATDTNANTPPVYQTHSHVLRNLLIGTAIAVGLGVGLAVGTGNTTPPPTNKNPAPNRVK
jgi:hypothetical protein